MKKSLLFTFFFTACLAAGAQTAGTPKPAATNKANVTAVPIFFESTLSSGNLNFYKTLTKDASGTSFTQVYSIVSGGQMNGGKSFEVKISRDFFDGPFQKASREIADRVPSLLKFVQEKALDLNDEKGWITLINYYNILK